MPYKNPCKRSRCHDEMCDTHISEAGDADKCTSSIVDASALMQLASDHPVHAAGEAQAAMTTLKTGFNRQRTQLICVGYASAYHMVRTQGAWEAFIRDPGWQGLSKNPKNNLKCKSRILHHVLRYIFRAEAKSARDRVRVYANMLSDRFNKGLHPDEIVLLTEGRGIEKLRKEGEATRRVVRVARDTENYMKNLRDLDVQSSEREDSIQPACQLHNLAQTKMMTMALAKLNARIVHAWHNKE